MKHSYIFLGTVFLFHGFIFGMEKAPNPIIRWDSSLADIQANYRRTQELQQQSQRYEEIVKQQKEIDRRKRYASLRKPGNALNFDTFDHLLSTLPNDPKHVVEELERVRKSINRADPEGLSNVFSSHIHDLFRAAKLPSYSESQSSSQTLNNTFLKVWYRLCTIFKGNNEDANNTVEDSLNAENHFKLVKQIWYRFGRYMDPRSPEKKIFLKHLKDVNGERLDPITKMNWLDLRYTLNDETLTISEKHQIAERRFREEVRRNAARTSLPGGTEESLKKLDQQLSPQQMLAKKTKKHASVRDLIRKFTFPESPDGSVPGSLKILVADEEIDFEKVWSETQPTPSQPQVRVRKGSVAELRRIFEPPTE